MTTLNLLCAGAAQGLVKALQAQFTQATGATVQARFGAVGAMKEALASGAPCDVMVVTDAMVDSLVAAGALAAEGRVTLGRVYTGMAVPLGASRPRVDTPEALKAALLAASAIYFPDPVRATAGIHFARVMVQLGVHDLLQARFRTYPAGAIAMRELAAAECRPGEQPIGCTQITEINYTEGVELVGALPPQFELATAYTAALSASTAQPELARQFISLIGGAATQPLRAAGGFEP
jgi:molybdate transport system substrate-binding protein